MVTRCFRATSQVERVLLLWGGLAEGALKTITPPKKKKQTLSVLTSLTFSDTNTIQSVSEPLKRQGTDMNSDRVSRNSIHKSITIQILNSKFCDQCFGISKEIIQNPYALSWWFPSMSLVLLSSCHIMFHLLQHLPGPKPSSRCKTPNFDHVGVPIFHGFPWLQLLFMGLPKVFQWASKNVSRFFQRYCMFLPAFSTESSSNDSYFSRFSQEFRCSTLLPSSPHCHPLPTVSAARASSLSAAPSAASRKTAKASACFFYTRKSLEYWW